MSGFITVAVFSLPQDAYIAKLKLESEGMRTFLKDELTIQSDNFLSQAIGGVRLQVLAADVNRAKEILEEGGFIQPEYNSENKFLQKIDRFTKKIPLIGHSLFVVRLLLFVAIIFVVIVLVLSILGYWLM